MQPTPIVDVGRGTRAILDLSALRHNLDQIRKVASGARVMAVVKANAYGHGIEAVAETLPEVDGFAVATLCEASRVRSVTRKHPVLLLEGVFHADDLEVVVREDLWMVVHSPHQIDLLAQAAASSRIKVWLKVDTGMNRLGFRRSEAAEALGRLRQLPTVDPEIVLMSHLANADDPYDSKTTHQLERFEALRRELGLAQCSLSNSGGIFGWEDCAYDWVRTGLALYGASPVHDRTWKDLGLRPCMTLRSTLIAVNHCRLGDSVGYGGVWRCPEDMPIGVVGIGYGDGYPRHADNGTPVWINGRVCPIVGRVSMDMLCVDLRRVPDSAIGDEVELWGGNLPIEIVARRADTIPYELLCGVTSRVAVEYRR